MRGWGHVLLVLSLGVVAAPAIAIAISALPVAGSAASELGSRHLELLTRSFAIAGGSTLLSLVWGVPTGLAVSRVRGLGGAVLEAVSYLPLLVPSIVVVMGWIYVAGSAGYVTRGVRELFQLDRPPWSLYSPAGVSFVLSLCYFPVVSMFSAEAFRTLREASVRAARIHAGPWARGRFLWLPHLGPYLATAGILVFLLSLSDHSVPSALMVHVYPVEILARLSLPGGQEKALVAALPLLATTTVLWGLRLALCARTLPSRSNELEESRIGAPPLALAVAILAIVLGAVVPLAFCAVKAGPPAIYARALRTAGSQVLASLETSSWAVLFLMLLSAMFAVGYRFSGHLARSTAEVAACLLLTVPGAAVGMGILCLEDLWPWTALAGHGAVVGYAAACRYIVFPALLLSRVVMTIPREAALQAAASGVGMTRTVLWILVPPLVPAVLAAACISFVFAMGELSATVLVYPPGKMTLTVRLASLLHFGEEGVVAALCLMSSAFLVGALLLLQLVSRSPLRLRLSRAS